MASFYKLCTWIQKAYACGYVHNIPYHLCDINSVLQVYHIHTFKIWCFNVYCVPDSSIRATMNTRSLSSWKLPCSEFSQLHTIFSYVKYGYIPTSVLSFQNHPHLYSLSFAILLLSLPLPCPINERLIHIHLKISQGMKQGRLKMKNSQSQSIWKNGLSLGKTNV